MRKNINLPKLSVFLGITAILIGLFTGLVENRNSSGGEQKLFSHVSFSILIALLGILGINLYAVLTKSFLHNQRKYLSIVLILFSIVSLTPFLTGFFDNNYDIVEKTEFIGSDKIEIKLEYYKSSEDQGKIRSISYFKNGKKDSTWFIYRNDGTIIKRNKYKNGNLVEF